MALELVVSRLAAAGGSFEKIQHFVKEDLASLLVTLGELDYRAAIDALRDAKKSSHPEREINIAVTCLRLAYEKFHKASDPSFLRTLAGGLLKAFTLSLYEPQYTTAAESAVECCLLISMCYASLNEINLLEKFTLKAKEEFESYARLSIQDAYSGGGLGGSRLSEVHAGRRYSMLDDERNHINKLCDELIEFK